MHDAQKASFNQIIYNTNGSIAKTVDFKKIDKFGGIQKWRG